MLLDQDGHPGLVCANCQKMRADAPPLCETGRGCPIYDLASDPDLQEFCDQFLRAKMLLKLTGDPLIQRRVFREMGLLKDLDLLFELERIYQQWMMQERQKSARS
jgi:hypothetical protein